jgi:hypothetical protein
MDVNTVHKKHIFVNQVKNGRKKTSQIGIVSGRSHFSRLNYTLFHKGVWERNI